MFLLTSIAWPHRGLRYRPTEFDWFFEGIRWQVATFQMIAGSSSIFFLKCIWNKSCSWAALFKFWIFWHSRLTFFTVTRWSRSTSNFYLLIGQNLTGEFMRKIYAASGNLFTGSWSWQSFVSSCDVFNCLFPRDVQNEIHLLSRLFKIIHGWFVYWVFGWLMRRLSKSSKIRFGMASFSEMSPLTSSCFMRKKVEKSQAILALLDGFQELHLDW